MAGIGGGGAGSGTAGVIAKGAMKMMVWTKVKVAAVVWVVLGLGIGCGNAVAQTTKPAQTGGPATNAAGRQDERIAFLIAQNEASYNRIKTGVYRCTERRENYVVRTLGSSYTHTQTVQFKGPLRFRTEIQMRGEADGVNDPPKRLYPQEIRSIIGPSYIGIWVKDHPVAEQYEHISPDRMSAKAKDRLEAFTAPDLRSVGFGLPRVYLREFYRRFQDRYHTWSVEEVVGTDGSKLFELRGYFKPDNRDRFLSRCLTFDPNRGFLITKARFYQPDGTLAEATDVTVEDVTGRGDWLPTIHDEKHLKPDGSLTGSLNLKFSYERINEPMEDSIFDVRSLQLPEELLVSHYDEDGNHDTYVVRNGLPGPQ